MSIPQKTTPKNPQFHPHFNKQKLIQKWFTPRAPVLLQLTSEKRVDSDSEMVHSKGSSLATTYK